MVFLQLHDNFKPKDFERVEKFVKDWPKEVPLAIEVRSAEWFEEENFEKFSHLLEENNMRTLFLLKRELETLVNSNGYNFTSNEDRKTFQRVATSKFATWIGVRVASLEIKYESNVWESERMIVHCYASVTFRAMSKQTIVEIDINKRTAGEATTTSGVISY